MGDGFSSVDFGNNRHPGTQLPNNGVVFIEDDFDRHALDDFGEIPRGIIWWQ